MNLIRRAIAAGSVNEVLDVRDFDAVAAVLNSIGYDDAKVSEVHKVYSAYYWDHCTENTVPYEGVLEFINWICSQGNNAAMLTNKPVAPAKKILEKFGLIGRAGSAGGTNASGKHSAGTSGKHCANCADISGKHCADISGKHCADASGEHCADISGNYAGDIRSADKIITYLCGDTSPERKPGPGGIYAILKKLGIAPEKAVMIGDDTPDVMAAKNAGIDSIICLEGFGRPENLLPLEPKYPIRHIKDLMSAVR